MAFSKNNPMPTKIKQEFTDQLSRAAETKPKPRKLHWLSCDNIAPFLF